ncbi:uncharacterized protein H6S33_010239 [Morchella sextelata]|uniref:uncharacterized protein n=1 Tax=Morchella sextelata TaxID=1174677 RepID=UPI001D042B5C|nr:uncharacterized protein H6S33_010239 [Morchella sextelata]KAH0612187.1 hypothetical protein H6S33_010239 [Morchella sextelata]
MVGIASIRSTNAAFSSTPGAKGLVAVFVGATSGIGETAMKTFVSSTVAPTVYFVGRSESSGAKITTELQKLNPDSKIQFFQADTTLLSNVDNISSQIATKEKKLNLLFMSPGYMSMAGREETPEGLDRKMTVSYYCRLKFATNLLPLLKTASEASESARVISVLGTSREGPLIMDDLGLAKPGNFTLLNCELHTVTMTSLAFEHLSNQNPGIGFIHAFPGFVMTGIGRELPTPLRVLTTVATPLMKCFSVPIDDCGQGFTWLGTDEKFRKGLWLVDWKGESTDTRTGSKGWMSRSGDWFSEEKMSAVWEHTMGAFRSAKAAGGSA